VLPPLSLYPVSLIFSCTKSKYASLCDKRSTGNFNFRCPKQKEIGRKLTRGSSDCARRTSCSRQSGCHTRVRPDDRARGGGIVFNALLRHTDRLETDPFLQTYSTVPAALVSAHPFHRSTDPTDSQSLKLKWNLDYAAILAEAVAEDFDGMRMQSCDP
jgi:hypothetical protein